MNDLKAKNEASGKILGQFLRNAAMIFDLCFIQRKSDKGDFGFFFFANTFFRSLRIFMESFVKEEMMNFCLKKSIQENFSFFRFIFASHQFKVYIVNFHIFIIFLIKLIFW